VPFLRFSRDKRGYENTYLVQIQDRRGKSFRQRILYWYRTPPGVRVGRPPFDEEARRRLEAQNPDVIFDWPAIIATPIPPPAENEQWRERRRAERAAKQAQQADDDEAALRNSRNDREAPAESPHATGPDDFSATDEDTPERRLSPRDMSETVKEAEPHPPSDDVPPTEMASTASESLALGAPAAQSPDPTGRKRRRRGGRRRRGRRQPGPFANSNEQTVAMAGENEPPVAPTASADGSNELSSDSETGVFGSNEE
jgi:hypothetical protein